MLLLLLLDYISIQIQKLFMCNKLRKKSAYLFSDN